MCAPSRDGTKFERVCVCAYVTEVILSISGRKGGVCVSPNLEQVCFCVKQEQRECQNSRGRIWGSNNRDWQRQTETQHHKHMLTNQKDGDMLKQNSKPHSSHLSEPLTSTRSLTSLLFPFVFLFSTLSRILFCCFFTHAHLSASLVMLLSAQLASVIDRCRFEGQSSSFLAGVYLWTNLDSCLIALPK